MVFYAPSSSKKRRCSRARVLMPFFLAITVYIYLGVLMHYELGSALKLVQKPIRGVPRGCLFFGRNFWLEINKRASQRVFTFGFLPNGIRNQNNVVKKSKLGLKRDLRLEELLKLHNRSNYGLKLNRPSGSTFAHTFARRVSAYISPTSPVFRTRRLTTL